MKEIITTFSHNPKITSLSALGLFIFFVTGCQKPVAPQDLRITRMDSAELVHLATSIEATVNTQLDEGLTLRLWGVDSLVADPIGISIDDFGRLYYTRTNRQKHSEFDIRSHQDWEIDLIRLQTIDDKRAFLRSVLSPENSDKNKWLADLNGDGSHDWRDLTVEMEHIYRLEDTSGDGLADLSQLMVEDFNDEVTDVAGAVLKFGDDLFVGVGPDLWRLKDKNGDGLADEKTSISHGFAVHIGFSGHGMSGLTIGPEGKIYWGIGDIGFNGVDKDGQKWEYPNTGVIVRCNPDGTDFEVFAYGVRNTHEFVFDDYGNLISVDNDGDHPGEKERIVYIVNGSDTGWRINWQFGKYRDPENNTYKVWMDEQMYKPRFEGQAAYITPAIENYISGPAGMAYNPGTALGPEWKNTFFVAEFVGNPVHSGIHAFKLKPKGASFELGENKKILSGIAVTGLDFGPDGALYVGDWVEGWRTKDHGRIWKLDAVDGPANPQRKETQRLLASDFKKYKPVELEDLLKNQDKRVRQKAQFELATRGKSGAEVFGKVVNQKENQLARVHAIWGISQFARKDQKHARLLLPLLKDSDAEIRAQAAKWIGDVRFKEAGEELIALLKDTNARVQFFAAEALGRIAYEPAVTPLISMLEANNDEDAYLRHAGSLALAQIGKSDPIVALANNPSRALRIAAVVALRRMSHPGIASFLSDADEFVVTETARAINDDLSIKEALPALGDLLATTPFTNEALIRRAINANLRTGTDGAMQNLIDYMLKEGIPTAMREEAIDALSTWSKPSLVDRVDGRYRGVIKRDPLLVKTKSGDVLIRLASHPEATVRLRAVKAIGKVKIDKASDQLFVRLKTDKAPEVRAEAIKSLAALNDPRLDEAIKLALADNEKRVRVAGLDLLAKTDVAKPLMVSLLAQTINTRTLEEKQAALLTLGKIPLENSEGVFNDLLNKLASGKLQPEVSLELAEAIDSTGSAQLKDRYKRIVSKSLADSSAAAFAATLFGGDADKGRRIFFRHQTAQCTRCHSFNDLGGNAGPRLNGIATKLSREQLLEALINPSARLAPGYGIVKLDLKDGKTVGGILKDEKSSELIIKVGDNPDTVIRKDQIVKRSNSPSSMPPMNLLLTRREIRDLLSFLSTLKEE